MGVGFDVVLGNPPWEIVKPDLREYYAQFDPDIESKLTRQKAEARIAALAAGDPALAEGWAAQKARIEAAAAYYKAAPDYTRQGRGDTATHKLFLERGYDLLKDGGRLAFVIPSGIYTDLGTMELRQMLLEEGQIEYLYNFSNERFFFPHVDHRVKFTLLGAQKGGESDGFWATFRFDPRVAVKPDDMPSFLADFENKIFIREKSLARFSPDSLSIMEFQTQRDYEVSEKVYGEQPLLGEVKEAGWNIKFNNEFHFTNDRHRLNQSESGIPLYEGKMIHQFDPDYAAPKFWISKEKLSDLPQEKSDQLKTYRVVHRRIARSTDERTLISTIVPPNSGCEVNATVVLVQDSDDEKDKLYLCSVLNSFILDYIIRYK